MASAQVRRTVENYLDKVGNSPLYTDEDTAIKEILDDCKFQSCFQGIMMTNASVDDKESVSAKTMTPNNNKDKKRKQSANHHDWSDNTLSLKRENSFFIPNQKELNSISSSLSSSKTSDRIKLESMAQLVKIPSFDITTCQTWTNNRNQKKFISLRSGILLTLDSKNEEIFNLICVFIYKGLMNSHSNAKEFHNLIYEKISRYFSNCAYSLTSFPPNDPTLNKILKLIVLLVDFYLKISSRSTRMSEKIGNEIIHECIHFLLDQSPNPSGSNTKKGPPPEPLTCSHLFALIDPSCYWLYSWMKNTLFRSQIAKTLGNKDNKLFKKMIFSSLNLISKSTNERASLKGSNPTTTEFISIINLHSIWSTNFIMILIKYEITRGLFKKKLFDKKMTVQDYILQIIIFISKPCDFRLRSQDFESDLSQILFSNLCCLCKSEVSAKKCFIDKDKKGDSYNITIKSIFIDLLESYDYEVYRRRNILKYFGQVVKILSLLAEYSEPRSLLSTDTEIKEKLAVFLKVSVQHISDNVVLDVFLATFKLSMKIYSNKDSSMEIELSNLLLDAFEINKELKLGQESRLNYVLPLFANSTRCLELFLKENLINTLLEELLFNPEVIIEPRSRKRLFYNLSQFQVCLSRFIKLDLFKSVLMNNILNETYEEGFRQLMPLLSYPSSMRNILSFTTKNNEVIMKIDNSFSLLVYLLNPTEKKGSFGLIVNEDMKHLANRIFIALSSQIEFSCFLMNYKVHLGTFMNEGSTIIDQNNIDIQHLLARISTLGGPGERYLPPTTICPECELDDYLEAYRQFLRSHRKRPDNACSHQEKEIGPESSRKFYSPNFAQYMTSNESSEVWKTLSLSTFLKTFSQTKPEAKMNHEKNRDLLLKTMRRLYNLETKRVEFNEFKFAKVDGIFKMAAMKFVNYGIYLGTLNKKQRKSYEAQLARLLKHCSTMYELQKDNMVNTFVCWLFLVTMGDHNQTYQIYRELFVSREFEPFLRLFQLKSPVIQGKGGSERNNKTLDLIENIKVRMEKNCPRILNILRLASIPEEQIIIQYLGQSFFNYLNYEDIFLINMSLIVSKFHLGQTASLFCSILKTQETKWNQCLIEGDLSQKIKESPMEEFSFQKLAEVTFHSS